MLQKTPLGKCVSNSYRISLRFNMLSFSRQENEVCDTRLAVRKGCKGVVVRDGGGGLLEPFNSSLM